MKQLGALTLVINGLNTTLKEVDISVFEILLDIMGT